MPITLGSNIAALQAQRQLFKSEKSLATVFERLASGQRINRASDDAAGLAISESLRSDTRVFNQGIRNLNDGISLLNIADATAENLSSIVVRLQELAEQAANGSLSNKQREALDTEAQELREEFFRVSREANFNSLNLFDGSIQEGVRLQGGYGVDGSIFSSLGGVLGNGEFGSATAYDVGTNALKVASGDLNGDGHLDLVTADEGADTVSIMLGNGDGSFRDGGTLSSSAPRSIIVADFNNDTHLDIAVAALGDDRVILNLGNGDGTFGDDIRLDVGTAPRDLQFGDLNNDGNLDIVTANRDSGDGSVLLGNGDGTFQSHTTFDLGTGPRAIELGDINSDGILDAVVANGSSNELNVLIGVGDGTFGPAQTYSVTGQQYNVRLGDLNGDGNLDIVSAGGSSSSISVLLGSSDGTFSAEQTYTVGGLPEGLELGDIDGDGNLDIVVGNQTPNNFSAFLGSGDGTFSGGQSFGTVTSPRDLLLGDFDGDGVLDVATAGAGAGGQLGISLGDTREGIAPILEFSLRTQTDALQAIAPLQRKLSSLSSQRGVIGAFQSRLESALRTLESSSENYSAANSRIRDADIAFESSNLTRLSILREAASSVLAQANQQPALTLQLLR